MATTRVNLGLLRFAMLAAVIAVVAFAIAMCSPSDDTSSSTGKPTVSAIPPPRHRAPRPQRRRPPPPSARGKDYVEGMVESVSGGTIALRTRTGSATVDFAPTTPVFQVTPAQLTDVTPGSCVNVRATPQSAPAGAWDHRAGRDDHRRPSTVNVRRPPASTARSPPSQATRSPSTAWVPDGQSAPTTVTVADTTSYKRQTASSTQAITNGTCMGAQGTNDGGALQATTISLEQCPPMGRPHHRFHLPHLPHLHL